MYGGGLVGACVYLWNLKEVRSLTASAHHMEDEMLEGDLNDQGPADGEQPTSTASLDDMENEKLEGNPGDEEPAKSRAADVDG
jgi:hypothetical protein